METKYFHLGDILSVTTRRFISPDGWSPIYKVLNFMTGYNLFSHQLLSAANECAPEIVKQHPQLSEINASFIRKGELSKNEMKEEREKIALWLIEQENKYGKKLLLTSLANGEY